MFITALVKLIIQPYCFQRITALAFTLLDGEHL